MQSSVPTPQSAAIPRNSALGVRHFLGWLRNQVSLRLVLWLLLLYFLVPILWTVSSSLKTRE
jgi:hypothetical protein